MAQSSFIRLVRLDYSKPNNPSIISFDLELYFCLPWSQDWLINFMQELTLPLQVVIWLSYCNPIGWFFLPVAHYKLNIGHTILLKSLQGRKWLHIWRGEWQKKESPVVLFRCVSLSKLCRTADLVSCGVMVSGLNAYIIFFPARKFISFASSSSHHISIMRKLLESFTYTLQAGHSR